MIVLHAAGNKHLGIGNLARTAYLSEYLCDLTPTVLLWETDIQTADFFKLPSLVEKRNVECRLEAFSVLEKLDTHNSIYISDIPDLDKTHGEAICRFGFSKTIHLNDSLAGGYLPDILIDEDLFEKRRFHGREADYFGAEYKIFRKSFLDIRPKTHTSKVEKILISFGGSDPGEYTEKIATIVGKQKIENISFVLGLLMSEKRKNDCRKLAQNCVFYDNPYNMPEIIALNDIVVSLGGITAYEAAFMGKTAVAVKWEHMAYYVGKLHDAGMLYAFDDLSGLQDMLENRASYAGKLLFTAEKGFEMITGNGGYAVKEIIKALL